MAKFQRGSEWRKWDLHFHTPASFDYSDRSVKNEEIVTKLIAANIAAVAITDHHVIDIGNIKTIKSLAGNGLTVFPGIELRSELGGSKSVHFVGIFPEDSDLEELWTKL